MILGINGIIAGKGGVPIVTSGLILHYDAGNSASYSGSGTLLYDLSPTNNTASLYNGVSFITDNVGTLVFDGNDDFAQPVAKPSVTNQITLETWCNLDNVITNDKWLVGVEESYRILYNGTSLQFVVRTDNNGWYTPNTYVTCSTTSHINKNCHIVATYNGSRLKLYINGVLQSTTTADISGNLFSQPLNPYLIIKDGSTSSSVDYGKRNLYQHRLYNRALSDAEILNNYNLTKDKFNFISDADAQAFITAASITDNTQKSAINQLVSDLKSANIWTKMKAIYPFVGGTASSHKFNLKDPRDLDAAFRLVFNGGWTHSSTGALPNGTTAYADTKFTPLSSWSLSNAHISYYSRTNISLTSSQVMYDAFIDANNCHQFWFDSSNSNVNNDMFTTLNGRVGVAISSYGSRTDGLYIGNRTSSASNKLHRNSSIIASNTNGGGNLPNIPLYMAAANTTGGAVAFSKLECSFGTIGDGLTDSEAVAFYNAVQTFNTTLSRQV